MADLETIYRDCVERVERWPGVRAPLESEWKLARRFGVARTAARRVMQRLVREGLAVSVRGKGYFSRPRQRTARRGEVRIGVVYEEALAGTTGQQNRILVSLIDALKRQNLDAALIAIRADDDRPTIASRAQTEPVDAFLLYSLPPVVQSQFAARNIPAVVFGNTYTELSLPSVAMDELGITRTLCENFLSQGHRCVAMIQYRSQNLGAERSRVGFVYAHHACRRRFSNDRIVLVDRHRGGRSAALAHVELLRPTALLVQNVQLLRWLWEKAKEAQRQWIAQLPIVAMSGNAEDLSIRNVKLVQADLDAAARVVAGVLRDTLRGRRSTAHHHSVPWRVE